MRRTAGLVALLLMGAAPPTPEDLRDAQRAQEEAGAATRAAADRARAAAAQADRLAADRVTAAAALRATETKAADMGARIEALNAGIAAAREAEAAQMRRLAPLLPLIERLGLYPAETLLSVPGAPEDAVRGLIVLRAVAQQVRIAVAELDAERAREAAAVRELAPARQELADTLERQRLQAATLDAQLAEAARSRDLARDAATAAASREAAAASRAGSLKAAIATLAAAQRAEEARRRAAPPSTPVAAGAGGWSVPVVGKLVSGFGAATEAGPATGVTYQTPPGARVTAPCGGRVVFAGPFRSYGRLLILQCAPDVHAVLSGLGRLDAAVGQSVRVGEPVGVMEASGGSLYVEIRRSGLAIDPGQYLRR